MTICGLGGNKLFSENEVKRIRGNDYHNRRLCHPTVRFSLKSRIRAISEGISKVCPFGAEKLLDVGTADGLLAEGVKQAVSGIQKVYGLDIQSDQLIHNPFFSLQGDCCRMPFRDNTFDIITAAAVIEHLRGPLLFLKECERALKPRGVLLLTFPAPFFDWLASCLGYLKDAGHLARYSLSNVRRMCLCVGLEVVLAQKFMITPIHIPYHRRVESLFRALGLSFLMLNQLVGCSKANRK